MKQDSIKSAQHHSNKSSQDHSHVSSQNSGGGGHLHHSIIQNDLKLGLGGMGVASNLGMMGGLVDNKTNQDILKAVGKVNS